MKSKLKLFFFMALFVTSAFYAKSENEGHRIAILVNDEVITTYDIVKRSKIYSIINQIIITKENNALIANEVVDELIDEKLKLSKAQEYDTSITKEEINYYEKAFFQNRNLDSEHIYNIFSENNISRNDFLEKIQSDIIWQTLIGKLYYRLTSVSDIEIEELLNNNPDLTIEEAKNNIIDKQLGLRSSKLLRDLRTEATIEYK